MIKLKIAIGLPDFDELKTPGAGIEKRSPEWTAKLFESLYKLLSLSKDELVDFLADNGVTQKSLIRKNQALTHTFMHIASKLPQNEKAPTVSRNKPKTIKPRSKAEVLKMWNELQRYL